MSTLICDSETAESTKQNSFIQIGKHRHKIADDHHAILWLLKEIESRYSSLEELLFNTSLKGSIHRLLELRVILDQVGDCVWVRKINVLLRKVEPSLASVEQRAHRQSGAR